jgi:pimeloyl-ACP methyl ester carboxylesterase
VTIDSAPFGALRVHMVGYGDGEPLLLVHGLMTSSYSWRYVLEPLGRRYRLFIPDLPGCGKSDPAPTRPHTAAALAVFLGEFQERLGISGCPAIGNSLGGYLCMQRTLVESRSFSRLVVIHAPALPELRLRALSVALHVPGVASALAWWVRRNPEKWAHRHVHYYDETLKSLEEAREYGEPLATREGTTSFVRYLRDTLGPRDLAAYAKELGRRRDAAEGFPVPLMLVYAREDPMVSPKIGPRLLALVPDHPEFHWLDRSSHFAQVDSPERLAPLLLDFLSRGPELREGAAGMQLPRI